MTAVIQLAAVGFNDLERTEVASATDAVGDDKRALNNLLDFNVHFVVPSDRGTCEFRFCHTAPFVD